MCWLALSHYLVFQSKNKLKLSRKQKSDSLGIHNNNSATNTMMTGCLLRSPNLSLPFERLIRKKRKRRRNSLWVQPKNSRSFAELNAKQSTRWLLKLDTRSYGVHCTAGFEIWRENDKQLLSIVSVEKFMFKVKTSLDGVLQTVS